MADVLEQTRSSVARMQDFDPETLPREQDLGTGLNFRDALQPARRLIGLYKRLSLKGFADLPDALLNQIKGQADADFTKFKQILDFNTSNQENPNAVRQQYIEQLQAAYDPSFQKLYPFISYGASVAIDFQRMDNEARAMLQSVRDNADEIMEELSKNRGQAEKVLDDVRKVAAEQGVSQKSIYFKDESDTHSTEAEQWRKRTIKLSWGLGIYAFFSIFFHKIPWIMPETTTQSVQLIASKVLVFGVISYMLFLSARNFMSHKHNAIVNKHRQNALMTFNALVDAAKEDNSKDIVLTHAAACIFSPQDTGYAKSASGGFSGESKSIIELLPKAMVKIDGS